MLQQSQGAVEVISSEACEDNMLLLPKGYQQHLISSCTLRVGVWLPLHIAAAAAYESCQRARRARFYWVAA